MSRDYTVRMLAYQYWESRGSPVGDDWTDWFWAEQLLRLFPNEDDLQNLGLHFAPGHSYSGSTGMRITALIAAGAVVELGAPSTLQLTSVVRKKRQLLTPSGDETNFLEQIADAVDACAKPWKANFEDYLAAAETLLAIYWTQQSKTPWPSKPVIAAFKPMLDPKWFNLNLLLQAGKGVIEAVGDEIIRYLQGLDLTAHSWFPAFWQNAVSKYRWDIATTNYDDSVERCLTADAWNDGFVPLEAGLHRFDPHLLASLTKTRVFHLHGSVYYGYRFADPNRFMFEDDHEDLYKFQDFSRARETWVGRSTNTAQSRESAMAGPIITGLRKTDKTLCYPYDCYRVAFHEAVRASPRLLVAGYSFGDPHLNHILQRITRLHGPARRVVMITYGPAQNSWHPDPQVMDWPSQEMYEFIATACRENRPFPTAFQDPIVSRDGTTRVYLGGMKQALIAHGSEILDFLGN